MVEELNAYGVQLFRETDVDEIATDLPYETYIDNSPLGDKTMRLHIL